jgi:hypothetical protein
MIGEQVYFRGDFNPSRIWNIKNIGDKFITIDTDNTQGLETQDSIKVVTPMDIYKVGDYSYNNNQIQGGNNNSIIPMPLPNQPFVNGGNINHGVAPNGGGINFAPVIKIMNGGSDYSNGQDAGNNEQQQPIQLGGSTQSIPISNPISSIGGFIKSEPPASNAHVAPEPEKKSSGILDFTTNLFKGAFNIKKV